MYCTQCGNELKENAKFCSSCGTAVKKSTQKTVKQHPESGKNDKSPKQSKNTSGIQVPIPAMIIGAGILIILGFLAFKPDSQTPQHQPTTSADQQQLRSQVVAVAKQFQCPCGDCSDNLARCDCTAPNGAVEVKRFIQRGLQDGKSVQQMVSAVSLKYQVSTGS